MREEVINLVKRNKVEPLLPEYIDSITETLKKVNPEDQFFRIYYDFLYSYKRPKLKPAIIFSLLKSWSETKLPEEREKLKKKKILNLNHLKAIYRFHKVKTTYKWISRESGLSIDEVIRWTNWLKKEGYITKEATLNDRGKVDGFEYSILKDLSDDEYSFYCIPKLPSRLTRVSTIHRNNWIVMWLVYVDIVDDFLYNFLNGRIKEKVYRVSVKRLVQRLGISRFLIRRALGELNRLGLIKLIKLAKKYPFLISFDSEGSLNRKVGFIWRYCLIHALRRIEGLLKGFMFSLHLYRYHEELVSLRLWELLDWIKNFDKDCFKKIHRLIIDRCKSLLTKFSYYFYNYELEIKNKTKYKNSNKAKISKTLFSFFHKKKNLQRFFFIKNLVSRRISFLQKEVRNLIKNKREKKATSLYSSNSQGFIEETSKNQRFTKKMREQMRKDLKKQFQRTEEKILRNKFSKTVFSLLDYWNSLEIDGKHLSRSRYGSKTMRKNLYAIKRALKEFSVEEIKDAIDRFAFMALSDEHEPTDEEKKKKLRSYPLHIFIYNPFSKFSWMEWLIENKDYPRCIGKRRDLKEEIGEEEWKLLEAETGFFIGWWEQEIAPLAKREEVIDNLDGMTKFMEYLGLFSVDDSLREKIDNEARELYEITEEDRKAVDLALRRIRVAYRFIRRNCDSHMWFHTDREHEILISVLEYRFGNWQGIAGNFELKDAAKLSVTTDWLFRYCLFNSIILHPKNLKYELLNDWKRYYSDPYFKRLKEELIEEYKAYGLA